ncbi:MAG: PQQ-binding-like beta-propeller repeat protein [Deltaproteobacteria bacterium]|nr:PQQ-binding-like beta-propeller repeat protein [Deltaproteobacteria bacterium]
MALALAVDGELGIDAGVRVHAPDGALVWSAIHELGSLRDSVGGIAADPSGDVYVSGSANVAVDGIAVVLRVSGSDGSELWRFEQDGPVAGTTDYAYALDLDDQGRVLAAIAAGDEQGQTDVELHALDPETGSSAWVGTWASPNAVDDRPFAMTYDAARGRVWVYVYSQADLRPPPPTLLAFEPPLTEPVLVAHPLEFTAPESALPRASCSTSRARSGWRSKSWTRRRSRGP